METLQQIKLQTKENSDKLKELQNSLPNQLNNLELKITNVRAETKKQVDSEQQIRNDELNRIKEDLKRYYVRKEVSEQVSSYF
jgi:TRAP-type mannitol/chloroaromatic compound transport system substrate-binding protein